MGGRLTQVGRHLVGAISVVLMLQRADEAVEGVTQVVTGLELANSVCCRRDVESGRDLNPGQLHAGIYVTIETR